MTIKGHFSINYIHLLTLKYIKDYSLLRSGQTEPSWMKAMSAQRIHIGHKVLSNGILLSAYIYVGRGGGGVSFLLINQHRKINIKLHFKLFLYKWTIIHRIARLLYLQFQYMLFSVLLIMSHRFHSTYYFQKILLTLLLVSVYIV